jgi:hypothetical protein
LPEHTNEIESLTVEQARSLVGESRDYELWLNGLTMVDAATAEALAGSRSDVLSLDGLVTIDAAAATSLATFGGSHLFLAGVTKLDADTAKALAHFDGDYLSLQGLTTLDAATAQSLVESTAWDGELPKLTTLTVDVAKALAGFRGERLKLQGLKTLDADAATALAGFKGYVFVSETLRNEFVAKNPLGPKTALAYVVLFKAKLTSVTALDSPDSVAIAQAFAARKGPLSLPNLKKISPKTLKALLEKEDVDIPLIETLELIPEPDGSVTEDFIVPERYSSPP